MDLEGTSSGLQVRVLGPIELLCAGEAARLSGGKPRLLLAALASRGNAVLSPEVAVDILWPDLPPLSARGLVHNYVSQLRKALPRPERLARIDGGYQLVLGPDELDSVIFERLAGDGHRCRLAGDPVSAARLLSDALLLWRGPALGGLADGPLRGDAQRLEELRLLAIEDRVEAMLELGRHGELIVELNSHVAAHPLRERFWSQLMRGLYAAGRQGESLQAYQQFRAHLDEELGLEPSPALAELDKQIASGALPRPADARAGVIKSVAAHRREAQGSFGRDDDLAMLSALAQNERLVTVVGPPGVGKTHLILRLVSERFGGAAAVAYLAPVTDRDGAVAALARALDLRSTDGDLLDNCIKRLRSSEQIVVIDNCEHVLSDARDLVVALMAACPRLTILTTSRGRLGLPLERAFPVAPLPVPPIDDLSDVATVPAVALFIERGRRARPDFAPGPTELATIADVVRRLDGLPLAIELAAGRLTVLGLGDLAERLDRALDLLEGGRAAGDARHRTLRAAVEWSYDLLDSHDRRLFRALSVFPDGLIS